MEARPELHPLFFRGPEVADRVKNLKPYDAVSSLDQIKANPSVEHFKLDWNESTISPSPKVKQALLDFLSNDGRLNWYPDMAYQPLLDKLARYAGCEASQLLLTNGSDSALDLLCQTFLNPGDNMVFPVPTYTHMLQFAERAGAELRGIPGENPFVPQLSELIPHIDSHTRIIYLANPNNPTGNVYSPARLLELAIRFPHALIVSDEAYFEFAGISAIKLVDEVPNLVVTRSFSKCFGLAGLRLGYIVANQRLISDLRRAHNPKSVNMMAQLAAEAALDDLPYYRAFVREAKRSAALFVAFCERRGIPCRPTYGNFVLVQFPNAPEIARRLSQAGVHVRDRSSQLPGVIRISLATEAQTRIILSRLAEILDNPVELRPVQTGAAPASV